MVRHYTRNARAIAFGVLAGTMTLALVRPVCGADASRVRSNDAELSALVREGSTRSATFRSLVDEVDRSDAVVYVQFGYCAFGHLNGCLLRFVAQSHGTRYLRILVTSDQKRVSHEHRLALIAHELQHALEVIRDREVVDVPTLERLYLRIGVPENGVDSYETSAARLAGDAVLTEISSAPAAPAEPRSASHQPILARSRRPPK